MTMKQERITQRVDVQGQPEKATHQPDWFIVDGKGVNIGNASTVITAAEQPEWGEPFGAPRPGHDVEFFVGGQEYFAHVAQAISAATETVFITGWQVNYAVEMGNGQKLLHCLDRAVENGASVYVMPWLAPPGPIDTGYLHTLLAVFHLNGTVNGQRRKGKAYCMPAVAQSDMSSINSFYSHHQKLVVVDGKKAYVGGIDLAYGRREDGRYSLKAEGRRLEEFYSQCVARIHTPSAVERQDCVTLLELIAAGFSAGLTRDVSTFFTSPSEGVLAQANDAVTAAAEKIDDAGAWAAEKWEQVNFLADISRWVRHKTLEQAQETAVWAWQEMPSDLRARILAAYESGAQHLKDVVDIVMAILTGADISRMPFKEEIFTAVREAVMALVGTLVTVTAEQVGSRPRYERLFDKMEQMPGSEELPDPSVQPRQPWHDVHCCVQGPAVYDLSRNFVQRWNATARNYKQGYASCRQNRHVKTIVEALRLPLPQRANCPVIALDVMPARTPAGRVANKGCWVQVLRSAPLALLNDEKRAGTDHSVLRAQNNCLKGMLRAINGAQYFLYIEGQFFQSDYRGESTEPDKAWSGPTSSQLSFYGLAGYDRLAEKMGIAGKPVNAVSLADVRWPALDSIRDDPEGAAFVASVKQILSNRQTMRIVDALAGSENHQYEMLNPVAKAIASRIERAIDDDLPFHVYLVVPVHPEGKLDEITIMRQVDLTMNALVHGPQSLVNAVRRALVARKLHKVDGLPVAQSKREARMMPVLELDNEPATRQWVEYLTLLNLRNHAVLRGRPVTEQIYIHSKLLIADDRVAVIGSANINDRSLTGSRDSELALIIAGGDKVMTKVDGRRDVEVSGAVHDLRVRLWQRLFGKEAPGRAATGLLSPKIIKSPAASATWTEIRAVAEGNAAAYDAAFRFIPRNRPHSDVMPGAVAGGAQAAGCIWPTWQYPDGAVATGKGGQSLDRGRLRYRMPFDPLFWKGPQRADEAGQKSWNVMHESADRGERLHGVAAEAQPQGVVGFIVALPVRWVSQESNNTEFSLAVLANNEVLDRSGNKVASIPWPLSEEKTT